MPTAADVASQMAIQEQKRGPPGQFHRREPRRQLPLRLLGCHAAAIILLSTVGRLKAACEPRREAIMLGKISKHLAALAFVVGIGGGAAVAQTAGDTALKNMNACLSGANQGSEQDFMTRLNPALNDPDRVACPGNHQSPNFSPCSSAPRWLQQLPQLPVSL